MPLMYKSFGENRIFRNFTEIFEYVINSHALVKNIDLKTKKKTTGNQKNCVVSLMNSILCSMNGNQELFNSCNLLRSKVNGKLLDASYDYTKTIFRESPNFKRTKKRTELQKINSNKQAEKITKLK